MEQNETHAVERFISLASGSNVKKNANDIKDAMKLAASLFFFYVCLSIPFRGRFPHIYQPKTYLGQRHERKKSPPKNPFKLLKVMFQTPDQEVIQSCGLDAFFFLRYIQFLFGLFLLFSLIVLPILLPLNMLGGKKQTTPPSAGNATVMSLNGTMPGGKPNLTGVNITDIFDSASMGHIADDHYPFIWAHFTVAIVIILIFCFAFFNELRYFVQIRQAWLRPQNRLDKRSSGTILLTLIPSERLNERDLTHYFAGFHGGVEHVWINRDVRQLTKKITERSSMIKLLEKLETELVLKANVNAKSSFPKALDSERRPDGHTENETARERQDSQGENGNPMTPQIPRQEPSLDQDGIVRKKIVLQPQHDWPAFEPPEEESHSSETFDAGDENLGPKAEKWAAWVDIKDRAVFHVSHGRSWFIRWFPFLGHREDGIFHCRDEIARLNGEIAVLRNSDIPKFNSAFVRFKTRSGARLALAAPHGPTRMKIVAFEPSYEDIIWANLGPGYYSHKARQLANIILVAVLIFLYAFPVAFAGILSEIDRAPFDEAPFNFNEKTWKWLKKHPFFLMVIQNGGPPLVLWLSRLIIPPALYWFAHIQGAPTLAHIQLMMQNGAFAFLFIQIFLIGSITSSSVQVLLEAAKNEATKANGVFDWGSLNDRVPKILAQEVPNAGTFFIGFLILGFVTTGGDEIGQVGNVFFGIWHWLRTTLGTTRTPRQIYCHQHYVPRCSLGTAYPLVTLYACIVLAFCVYQPAILGLGVLGFGLLWVGYGYSLLYVTKVHGSRNGTHGAMFVRAMNQTFSGVYVLEICLVGIFAQHEARLSTGKSAGNIVNGASMNGTTEDLKLSPLYANKTTDAKDTVPAHNETSTIGSKYRGHGALWQGILMSLVFIMTVCCQILVNRWLRQVGMGLHASSDRRYEDLGLDDASSPEKPGLTSKTTSGNAKKGKDLWGWQWIQSATGSQARRREGRGKGKEPEKKKEPAEGCTDIFCNDFNTELLGEQDRAVDDYLPKFLRPAAYQQQILWIPDDGDIVGVGRDEARLCCEAGVEAVVGGAEVGLGISMGPGKEGRGCSEKIKIVVRGIPTVVEVGTNFFLSELPFYY